MEHKQGGPYKPMTGILMYKPDQLQGDIAKIEKRIVALREGEVKARDGNVIAGNAAHEEYRRLEDLKKEFKKAAEEGMIETKLLDQIMFF